MCAALLDQPARIANGILDAGVIAHERHVDGHVGAPYGRADRSTVVGHLIDSHRQGVLLTLDHHAQGVTDQDDIHAGTIEQPSEGRVISGQHGDLAGLQFHLLEIENCHRLL